MSIEPNIRTSPCGCVIDNDTNKIIKACTMVPWHKTIMENES